MEQWIPLMVAAVGAIAAIGVAFWNTRGESIELRQLKAMNEAAASLVGGSDEAKVFAVARDALAVRIAQRVLTAPARRRLGWYITAGIFAVGVVVGGSFLLLPITNDQTPWAWVGSAISLVALLLAGIISFQGLTQATRDSRLNDAARESRSRLRALKRANDS